MRLRSVLHSYKCSHCKQRIVSKIRKGYSILSIGIAYINDSNTAYDSGYSFGVAEIQFHTYMYCLMSYGGLSIAVMVGAYH